MKVGRWLIDTNHAGEAVRPVSRLRDRILQAHRQGVIFGLCLPVLCELEIGIRQLKEQNPTRRELRELLKRVRVWPIEGDFPSYYAGVYQQLKAAGRSLSQIDIMLAALCRQKDLCLLTTDRDFEALPDLRVENWSI